MAKLAPSSPSLADYRALAEFRYQIRLFLSFSEKAAREAGLEPQQHQLLLACKGLPEGGRPTIRTLAGRMCLEHNSVVQLADKLEKLGFVERMRSAQDRREVLLAITPEGEAVLAHLSTLHQDQLRHAGRTLWSALGSVLHDVTDPGARASSAAPPPAPSRPTRRPRLKTH